MLRMEDYWDVLAEEAKSEENAKSDEEFSFKNWVTEYADAKAKNLVFTTFGSFISLDSDAKVLDIACGLGKWTRLYAEKGFFTIGVDASARMISLARKSTNGVSERDICFCAMDAATLGFRDRVLTLLTALLFCNIILMMRNGDVQ